MTTLFVYKITSKSDWQESQAMGVVKRSPLDTQFIHMCEEDQIEMIVSKFWKNEADVMVLKIDASKLEGRLVKEKNPGGNTEYYHLYDAEIPVSAVVHVITHKDLVAMA